MGQMMKWLLCNDDFFCLRIFFRFFEKLFRWASKVPSAVEIFFLKKLRLDEEACIIWQNLDAKDVYWSNHKTYKFLNCFNNFISSTCDEIHVIVWVFFTDIWSYILLLSSQKNKGQSIQVLKACGASFPNCQEGLHSSNHRIVHATLQNDRPWNFAAIKCSAPFMYDAMFANLFSLWVLNVSFQFFSLPFFI